MSGSSVDNTEYIDSRVGKEAREKIYKYMDYIIEKNEHINLTAVRDRDEFIEKHIIDSLSICKLKEYKEAKRIVDLGTGAGFPGIPLAITDPDKQILLLDSVNKKLKIIDEYTAVNNIKNTVTLHNRAEDAGNSPKYREKYDMCVSRAVAHLNVLVEWCLPLVKIGGTFVAYKGEKTNEEIGYSKKAIRELGGELVRIERENPNENNDMAEHSLIIIKKIKKTPDIYPRPAGLAKKNPII